MEFISKKSLMIIILLYITVIECKLSIEDLRNMGERVARKKCMKVSGASEEQIFANRKGDFSQPDRNIKCYYKCIFETIRVIKDNELIYENAIQQVKTMIDDKLHSRILDVINACYNEQTKTEICEKSFEMVECVYRKDPELYAF